MYPKFGKTRQTLDATEHSAPKFLKSNHQSIIFKGDKWPTINPQIYTAKELK